LVAAPVAASQAATVRSAEGVPTSLPHGLHALAVMPPVCPASVKTRALAHTMAAPASEVRAAPGRRRQRRGGHSRGSMPWY